MKSNGLPLETEIITGFKEYLHKNYEIKKDKEVIKKIQQRWKEMYFQFKNNLETEICNLPIPPKENFNKELIMKEIKDIRCFKTQEILLIITVIKVFHNDYEEIKEFILKKGIQSQYYTNSNRLKKKKISLSSYNTSLKDIKETNIVTFSKSNNYYELNKYLISYLINYTLDELNLDRINFYKELQNTENFKKIKNNIDNKGRLKKQYSKYETATINSMEIDKIMTIDYNSKNLDYKIKRFKKLKSVYFSNYDKIIKTIVEDNYIKYLEYIYDEQIRKNFKKSDKFNYLETYKKFILAIGEEFNSFFSTLKLLKKYQGNYKKLLLNFIKDMDKERKKIDVKNQFDIFGNIITYSERNIYKKISKYEPFEGEYSLMKNFLYEGCNYYKDFWIDDDVLENIFEFFEMCGLYYYFYKLSPITYPSYVEKINNN